MYVYIFVYVKTFSSLVVQNLWPLYNGAERSVANITFNQIFRRNTSKCADFHVISIILPKASDEVQLSLIAFQRAKDKALRLPIKHFIG